MHVLVTSGGTRDPVDDVRVLSNTSSGRLGAQLARVFAEAGHEVLLLHGQGAALPRLELGRQSFGSSAELARLLEREVPRADVVLHAAAVADYVPEPVEGKIGSDQERLVLLLRRAPKLIDGLRDLAPAALLVGFKLSSGLGHDQRLARARRLLQRARLDLVVSNQVGQLGEDDHQVLLIDRQTCEGHGGGKAAVAGAILRAVQARLTRDLSQR